jgi:transcriptional regulator with XRE-family HTH domain
MSLLTQNISNKRHYNSMITGAQVRAAKAMLRWSGDELAQKAGVSLSSIRRIEANDGIPEDQSMRILLAVVSALEEAGIEFIGAPEDKPGVRLKG